jgi:hypothetical protein
MEATVQQLSAPGNKRQHHKVGEQKTVDSRRAKRNGVTIPQRTAAFEQWNQSASIPQCWAGLRFEGIDYSRGGCS